MGAEVHLVSRTKAVRGDGFDEVMSAGDGYKYLLRTVATGTVTVCSPHR